MITLFEYTNAEINVFSKPHIREPAKPGIGSAAYSHIKTARVEFIHFLLSTAYTAGRKERSHRIIDCLLDIGERIMVVSFLLMKEFRLEPD